MACRGGAGQGFMTQMGLTHRIRNGIATGLALSLTASFALAQQAAVGGSQKAPPRLTFNLSTSLTSDSNPTLSATPKAQTTLDTRLGLDFNTATAGQSLSFAVNGLARAASGDGVALRDPSADLSYQRDNGNSRFSVSGLYRQAPVDLFEPLVLSDGSVSTTDILATKGTITTTTAGVGFETGLQRPLGFDVSGHYSARDYSDTTDPTVFNSTSRDLKAGVHLRMASGDQVNLTASTKASDSQNATKTATRTQDVSLGYTRSLSPTLKLQTALGQTDATTRQSGVVTSHSNGLTGSLGLDATLPNGTASATLTVARDSRGTRQTLSFGRSLKLPNGTLSLTAGVSARSGAAGQMIGTLAYAHTLPTESFGVNLSRQVTLNADSQDATNTVLGLTYQHKINPVSDIGLSVNVLATGGGTGVAEATRQSLRATYSHDLTADWQMTAGYQFRSLDKSTTGTADSSSIFLTLSRKFTLLP